MVEVGDRVTVEGYQWDDDGNRVSGPLAVTGYLTNYRMGWLTVRPDEGEPVTIQFAPKGLRRLWPTYIAKEK